MLAFLSEDESFREICRRYGPELKLTRESLAAQCMLPVTATVFWGIPKIESIGELAQWFRLPFRELEWFADLKGLERSARSSESLRHYHYQIVEKRSGGLRLIESPKQRMKALQRQILEEVVNRIPAHEAVHGFVKGRSIRTFAQPHAGQTVVLRMDLQNFFPSIRSARIQGLFRTLGYPETVADIFGGICTNSTPQNVFRRADQGDLAEEKALYARSHLPQGAPTSPALANACCYRMDCRLAGLAKAAGATYTRYADDLAFSGGPDFQRAMKGFEKYVAFVVADEGLVINFRKTRTMNRATRQHLAGLVVNDRLNVKRADIKRLEAILTNCIHKGPASQNREGHPFFRAHLEGKVVFVSMINPDKGGQLRVLFERIQWE